MAEQKDSGTFSFVTGMIVGLLVSAPAVAWLSPRSGAENREAITQQGIIIRRKVADTLRKPVEQVQEQIQQLKGDSVSDAIEEGKAIASQRQQSQE